MENRADKIEASLSIREVRERLLNNGLLFSAIVAPVVLLISLSRALETGWNPLYTFHIVAVSTVVLTAIFRRRIPYAVRGGVVLGLLFLLGAVGIFVLGIVTPSYVSMFAFTVFTTVMFGMRAGLIACVACLIMIISAGAVICSGAVTVPLDVNIYSTSLKGWAMVATSFMLFVPLSVVGFGVMYNSLHSSFRLLRESEARHHQIFDSTYDAIILMQDGRYVDCNAAALKMFKTTREEVIGQRPEKFSAEKQSDGRLSGELALEIEASSQGGEELQIYEWLCRRSDGVIFPVEVNLSHITIGEEDYLLTVLRDISRRKELEQEMNATTQRLQQAYKMEAIGTLAGGIAHDFNNILTSVLGFAELVKMDLADQAAESLEDINSVIDAGLRAKDLVRQILTFSRETQTEKAPVMLASVVKEIVKLLKASLPASVQTHVNIHAADKDMVLGEPSQIQQIVMNLCVNAGHAMKTGGRLDLSVDKAYLSDQNIPGYEQMAPGEYLKLTVSDTGHGMSKEVMARIFDPFFTTKGREEGTGMGLAVAHGIVHGMGGGIYVESEPEQGTTFTVLLPAYYGDAAAEPLELSEPENGSGRILFVDDETAITTVAGRSLERLGYAVTTHNQVKNALEQFKADPQQFDLVFTDLDMPEMSGIEFSHQILQLRSDIPIILCSGTAKNITSDFLDEIGVFCLVRKPLRLSELSEIAKEALK